MVGGQITNKIMIKGAHINLITTATTTGNTRQQE
jgi:hypothetical protein